jgi:hypothetical protein
MEAGPGIQFTSEDNVIQQMSMYFGVENHFVSQNVSRAPASAFVYLRINDWKRPDTVVVEGTSQRGRLPNFAKTEDSVRIGALKSE